MFIVESNLLSYIFNFPCNHFSSQIGFLYSLLLIRESYDDDDYDEKDMMMIKKPASNL